MATPSMIYVFGNFRLDARRGVLWRGTDPIQLEPIGFAILKCLAENSDDVVSKRDLIRQVWPDGTASEAALHVAVSKLRRLLGQRRGERQPISTEHGLGYRLNCECRAVTEEEAEGAHMLLPSTGISDGPAEPFLGRADLMRQLNIALEWAASGWSQFFTIEGEAGIGKTRTAEELAKIAARRGMGVTIGRCLEHQGTPVFWPWRSAFREAAGILPRKKMEAIDKRGSAQLSELVLGLRQNREERMQLSHLYASDERFRLYDTLTRILLSATEYRARLLILDDLHLSDTASLELASVMASQMSEGRVLIVGTLRDTELSLEHPNRKSLEALLRMRVCQRVRLKGFQEPDVAQYMTQLTRSRVPEALASAVFERTGGNPFFVQATVQLLVAKAGSSDLSATRPSDVELPDAVRDVVGIRLDGLDADTRELIEMGSVIGRSFDLITLQQSTGLSREEILSRMARAETLGLVQPKERIGVFAFSHELVGETIYKELSSSDRARSHRRVAEALESRSDRDSFLDELAYHYYHALPDGPYKKAIQYALSAAAEAKRVMAYGDAAAHYGRALHAMDFHPEPDVQKRCELILARADALGSSGNFAEAASLVGQAADIARRHGFSDVSMQAGMMQRYSLSFAVIPQPAALSALEHALQTLPPDAVAERSRVLAFLSWLPPYSFDMERNGVMSSEAVELANRTDDPRILLDALAARAHSLTGPDHIAELLEVSEQMLELAEAETAFHWAMTDAHLVRVRAWLQLGDLDAAEETLEGLWQMAVKFGVEAIKELCKRLRTQIFLFQRGQFDEAESRYRELDQRSSLSAIGRTTLYATFRGFLQRGLQGALTVEDLEDAPVQRWPWLEAVPMHRAARAFYRGVVGQRDESAAYFDKIAKSDFQDIPKDGDYVPVMAFLAATAVMLEDKPKAQILYDLMKPYAHLNATNLLAFFLGSASYFLGILAHLLDRRQDAAAHFENALVMNERLEVPMALTVTQFSYAQMLLEDPSPDARARGQRLVDAALETTRQLGLKGLTRLAPRS